MKVKNYYKLSTFLNNIFCIQFLPSNQYPSSKVMTYYFVVTHKMIYDRS